MAPPNDDSFVSQDKAAVLSKASIPASSGKSLDKVQVPPTDMIYYSYKGNFQLECDAEVLSCQFISPESDKNGTTSESSSSSNLVHVSLNRTVLHAQGGGQPTDTGIIELIGDDNENTNIIVEKVLLDRATGVANHMGKLVFSGKEVSNIDPDSLVGQPVTVRVDAENRAILSECHTAGHVVDMAMAQCDAIMPPTKAYHFLDGPYVEYQGTIPPDQRGTLLERLQIAFRELVEADIATEIHNVTRSEAEELCNRVAENFFNLKQQFQEDELVRIVNVAGWPCPCGGTHVKSTGLLKERNWGVTGLKCKKGVVRVRYGQVPIDP